MVVGAVRGHHHRACSRIDVLRKIGWCAGWTGLADPAIRRARRLAGGGVSI